MSRPLDVQTRTQTDLPGPPPETWCTPLPRMVVHRPSSELEPPAMQGANDFALFDPPLAKRAPLVRAAVRKGNDRLSVAKKPDPQPGTPLHPSPSGGNLVKPAYRDPLGHTHSHPLQRKIPILRNRPGITSRCPSVYLRRSHGTARSPAAWGWRPSVRQVARSGDLATTWDLNLPQRNQPIPNQPPRTCVRGLTNCRF